MKNYPIQDWDSDKYADVEAEFKEGADIKEGVSGRKSIDTSFENTAECEVQNPRSEQAGDEYTPEPEKGYGKRH